MKFDDIAGFISQNSLARKITFFIIYLTTLREWYIFSALNKLLKNKKQFSMLDAGCGIGQHSIMAAKKYPNSLITGIDAGEKQINGCRQFAVKNRLNNTRFLAGSLESDNLSGSFDVILCASVLEHIQDDLTVIRSFYNLLNDQGNLLIYVPTSEQRVLKTLDKKIQKLTKAADNKYPHGHVRYYTRNELVIKLENAGFRNIHTTITYGPFGRLAYDIVTSVQYSSLFWLVFPFYFLLLHPFVLVLMLIDYLSQNNQGNGLLLIAQKVQ